MQKTHSTVFADLGISHRLLEQLDKRRFMTPTPIQAKAIPLGIEGKDIIGIAQTGTGKTLAFSLPMIQTILETKTQGLVLLPTRELALQVEQEIQKIGNFLGIKTAVLIGGASMSVQLKQLRRHPHIIVATPGRLIDHLEQKNITLNGVTVLVLDEADRMLDMGFEPQIKKILSHVPRKRQTLLFSATMPHKIVQLTKQYMHQPVRIEVSPAGSASKKITQGMYLISKEQKIKLLFQLIKELRGPILVFTRTKHGAKKLTKNLRGLKQSAAELHSNRSVAQRKEALGGFKNGKYKTLVATDIASRGIDVKNIELVVNYDLPEQIEDYVHRIGRTGRAGHVGKAVSFVSSDQKYKLKQIQKLIRTNIAIIPTPVLEELPALVMEEEKPSHKRGFPRRKGKKNPFKRKGFARKKFAY